MKIAILGTRGIPNNYGGFEQFAEYLSVGLVEKGHEVTVYNPHFHRCPEDMFHGVAVRYIYNPELWMGASAHFIYDFLCLKDALKEGFDVILECGYHSNAPSYYLMKGRIKPLLVTNMDGLEWMRSKWNRPTRWLIRQLEKLAVNKSHLLVSDNQGIQNYYKNIFNKESAFIPYGAEPVLNFDKSHLQPFSLEEQAYYLLIARLEPENNIETILDGYLISKQTDIPFIVIGNIENKYGNYLKMKYTDTSIRFVGSIYDKHALDSLRYYASIYFHGHSVGGTNPSLLEAMASQAFIIAHDNEFNGSVCGENAYYFTSKEDVSTLILANRDGDGRERKKMIQQNLRTVYQDYSWNHIVESYENLFLNGLESNRVTE